MPFVGPPEYEHELKSWVGLFEPLWNGEKKFDLRVMDRDFKVGDVCWVREYDPLLKKHTGRDLFYQITHITSSKHGDCAFSPFALHPATAILSVELY